MKNHVNNLKLLSLGAGIVLAASQAFAAPVNITIANPSAPALGGDPATDYSSWYRVGTGPLANYQTVNPGMVTGADWNLAAFVADTSAKTLGVLSGYDLQNGLEGTTLGDIFVSANPPQPTTYPAGTTYPEFVKNGTPVNGTSAMNWDFSIKMNWTNDTYTVYQLDANSVLENGIYNSTNGQYPTVGYNSASMPWALATSSSGITGMGTQVAYSGATAATAGVYDLGNAIYTSTFTYTNTLSGAAAAQYLVDGTNVSTSTLNSTFTLASASDYKYFLNLQNMQWLSGFQQANFPDYFHLTMSCGNDDLWGDTSNGFQTTVPDGGATVLMLGVGLAGLVGLGWRKRK